MFRRIAATALAGILASGLLAAPHAASAQGMAATKTYEVTITNITSSMQGLSPFVVATHPTSAHAWQMGQPASPGLALLAREGMPDKLVSELKGVATDVQTTHTHLLPGDSITVRVKAHDGDVLSAAGMLIQTNDGFTGLDSVALSAGDKDAMAYDAGAEDNTEAKADVPGPPFGGKNHGPDTNPRQPIAAHPGISGKADVTSDFAWSGPVARFSIHEAPNTPAPAGTSAYDVTITNINSGMQGLSPFVIASHPASAHAWQMGQPASPGLALLAREGMPDKLVSELQGVATDVQTTHAHLLPGDSITVRVNAKAGDVLSAAGMLIQTNDGFTGLDNMALSASMADKDAMAYDAGAEDNTEAKADVPGPPFGGKNHGPDTTPPQPIVAHPGISGKADVTPDFAWSGPVARFSVHPAAAEDAMMGGAAPGSAPDSSMAGSPAASGSSSGTSAPSGSGANSAASAGSMPLMPRTGEGDSPALWLVLSGAALALLLSGLAVRRRAAQLR